MSGENISTQKVALHCPSLEEVAKVLEAGLLDNFEDASACVVDCPDMTQEPFNLAAQGLCGSPRVTDVGGVPNLMPSPNKSKVYNLEKIALDVELPGGLLIGAGAGPHHFEGVNCEMMANIRTKKGDEAANVNTHICKVNPQTGGYILKKPDTTDFCFMGNLYVSEGKPGKVIEVKASKRKGPQNLMVCLRKTLAKEYETKPVALGGSFLVEKGKAKLHVMPNFSDVPLDTDEKVDEWLNFYEMSAPLNCIGYLISHDPDLDLRIEHFHCFSSHGDGGHYHYDTTPQDVQYRGYFNVAEYIYRIDRPKETHMIGRD